MLNVSLIEYTAKPQNVVAMAAKLCYSGKNMQDLKEEVDSKDAGKFVEMLREIGHESPLEHISFTFGVEGISRACLAQLTRHRIASFNVQSQRYVGKEDFLFVMPPSIERDEEAKEVFLKAM
ncbi:MAG: FAD-dependent thymidylate synthase, partial [Oscillospiraceae bacterium]